jgi:hypothetical protein
MQYQLSQQLANWFLLRYIKYRGGVLARLAVATAGDRFVAQVQKIPEGVLAISAVATACEMALAQVH